MKHFAQFLGYSKLARNDALCIHYLKYSSKYEMAIGSLLFGSKEAEAQ